MFEIPRFETIARLSAPGPLRADGRVRSLPLSVALHGLAIGAVALLSIRSLPDPSDPPIPVVFLEGSAPPLLLGEVAGTANVATVVQAPPEPDPAPIAPTDDGQDEEVSADPTEQDHSPSATDSNGGASDAAAAAAGDPRGQTDGRPDGRADSRGIDGKDPGDSQRPYKPGGNVVEPRLVERVEPAYPEIARKAHIEGVVVLEAIIGRDGAVEDLHIVKSANVLLDASALTAVARWRYTPATLQGTPVRVFLTVTVEFHLR